MLNLQTLKSKLCPNMNIVSDIYKKSGYYVFKRIQHTGNQYYSYISANAGNASKQMITYPAFPFALFPPDDILLEMEKSPALSFSAGIRLENWKNKLGYYEMCLDDFENTGNKKFMDYEKKLIYYLKSYGDDKYIYSVYIINIKSDNEFCVFHLSDFTKKSNGWSKKSEKYSSTMQNYTVKMTNNELTSLFS